ncbi:MAG: HAD hydrolase-like protein [Syntrophobacterales bacterium]|jgi:putative hydrolase of the HAD superfamily|nr:HAD hydrolase-like protein [Syntrophobacterales bacterium]
MIKLFVFDLGNVILPFEHRQIAIRLLKKTRRKIVPSPQEFFSFMFDMENGLVNPYEEGLISSMEFFVIIRDRYELQISFDEFKNIWNPIFQSNPDMDEAIQYLKFKRLPLFLLSNTNELHFSYIIKTYPIVHAFDEWILSFEVGAKKPKKRIFDVIFEKMDISSGSVFYVDDIAENVDAARACWCQGMVFKEASELWEVIRKNEI